MVQLGEVIKHEHGDNKFLHFLQIIILDEI